MRKYDLGDQTETTAKGLDGIDDTEVDSLESISALAVIPTRYFMATSKLSTMISDPANADKAEFAATVSKAKAKKPVVTKCVIIGDADEIATGCCFTVYDKSVDEAIASLVEAGNHTVTVDMIWRVMNGKTDQERSTPQQRAAITKSIDKQRRHIARIDCSEEIAMRGASLNGIAIDGGGFDENLLMLRARWIKAGNKKAMGYDILAMPVIVRYSKVMKQVTSVPLELLDIKKVDKSGRYTTHSLEYTDQRLLLKTHMLHRIQGMKANNALRNHCITLCDYERNGRTHSGLYSIAGYTTPTKKQKFDVREDVEAILTYWAKACKYIKGFEPYKEGRTIAGYRIFL